MSKVTLNPFNCPTCKDGTLVRVDVDEDAIMKATRLPAMITVSCSKNHTLVVFVDRGFQVRDVEAVVATSKDVNKDALDKTTDWFGSM